MRVVFYCQQMNGSHFVRGVITELRSRNCDVVVLDPFSNRKFARDSLDEALDGADLVLAQAGLDRDQVCALSEHRTRHGRYRLLFYDTGHEFECSTPDLSGFDGVLAGSEAIRDEHVRRGLSRTSWTWHEAADTSIFRPFDRHKVGGDVVWMADGPQVDRVAELFEFLVDPVSDLDLRLSIYGGKYPEEVQVVLEERGIVCAGPVCGERTPEILADFRAAVHIPRKPYPATRVFEALACGIPLISAPWDDADTLFTAGQDYLTARTGDEMWEHLHNVIYDDRLCADLSLNGLTTILSKHTCAHRVDELVSIYEQLVAIGEFRYAGVQ